MQPVDQPYKVGGRYMALRPSVSIWFALNGVYFIKNDVFDELTRTLG